MTDPIKWPDRRRRLILASASRRRRRLLNEHDIEHTVRTPPLDDGHLERGDTPPAAWVVALAHLKARAVADTLTREHPKQASAALVLGADTVVVKDDRVIGQPRDRAHAATILRTLRDGRHRVITGVALIEPGADRRLLLVDAATVTIGALTPELVDPYLESEQWRGKAGAYNLEERIEAGWPIRYAGDPATVMGLPMRRLLPIFDRLLRRGDPAIVDPDGATEAGSL